MIQRGDGPRFFFESRAVFGFQPLDGDDAIEARVAGFPDFGLAT
jgi:hypothetical protein